MAIQLLKGQMINGVAVPAYMVISGLTPEVEAALVQGGDAIALGASGLVPAFFVVEGATATLKKPDGSDFSGGPGGPVDAASVTAAIDGTNGTQQATIKTRLALDSVNNTSDANKPVSTAQATAISARIASTEKGAANGVATLDATTKIPSAQLPAIPGTLSYQGTWNASTNSPAIPAASAANNGYYYKVSVAGATLIDGVNDWGVGDWIISRGSAWEKIDNSDQVGTGGNSYDSATYTKAQLLALKTAGTLPYPTSRGFVASDDPAFKVWCTAVDNWIFEGGLMKVEHSGTKTIQSATLTYFGPDTDAVDASDYAVLAIDVKNNGAVAMLECVVQRRVQTGDWQTTHSAAADFSSGDDFLEETSTSVGSGFADPTVLPAGQSVQFRFRPKGFQVRVGFRANGANADIAWKTTRVTD